VCGLMYYDWSTVIRPRPIAQ